MSKSLFIIYTPYQMLSALSVIETYHLEHSDIMLMHPNMLRYQESINTFIDGNIIVCKEFFDTTSNRGWIGKHIHVLKNIIRKINYIKHNTIFCEDYDALYVPSDDTSCRVIYSYLSRKRLITLNLFDDGVGTYSGYIFKQRMIISKIIYGILVTKEFYERLDSIYCYKPELIMYNHGGISIKQINYRPHKELFEDEIENKIAPYIGKKVIFLDQGFSDKEQIWSSLETIKRIFGVDPIIVKKHPRIDGISIYDGLVLSKDGLPFEALLTILDINKCVLMSYSSTGCLSPALLTDENPFVIMLNGIDNDNKSIEQLLFDRINALQKDTKLFLPRSICELEEYLVRIKSSVCSVTRR